MITRTCLTLAFGILFWPSHAAAADEAAPPICTVESATLVSYREFLISPQPYFDKCVRVRGVIAGMALFPTLKAAYARHHEGLVFDRRDLIAVYSSDATSILAIDRLRGPIELIGRASSCERDVAEAVAHSSPEEEFIDFQSGTCRYYQKFPLIRADSWRILPGAIRFLGEAARRRYGDLAPLDASAPSFAAKRATAEGWFEAVAARDGKRIDAINGRNGDFRVTEALIDPAQSSYAMLFGSKAIPPIRYFRLIASNPGAAPITESYGCVCIRGTCNNQWPVDSLDVSAAGDPPYRCAVIVDVDSVWPSG